MMRKEEWVIAALSFGVQKISMNLFFCYFQEALYFSFALVFVTMTETSNLRQPGYSVHLTMFVTVNRL